MWYPKYIRIQNLFSHNDTFFKFKKGEMIMLLGIIEDNKGANSNGSGKSAIIEGLTLAIDGNVYRGVNKEDFIKEDKKNCFVDFLLQNDVLNQEMRIKRTIFSGSKAAKLEIYINNEFPKQIPTSTNGGLDIKIGNKFIYDSIGITREDFLNYFVIGQGNRNSFFTSNDTKQKEIISRFSNFTAIDGLLEDLNIKSNSIKQSIIDENSEIELCDEMIQFIKDEISEKKINFQKEKKTKIDSKLSEINNNDVKISDISKKIKENENKLSKKRLELSSIKILDATKLNSLLEARNKELSSIKKEIRETDKLISELNSKTGEFIECPSCKTNFIPDEDLDLELINQSIIDSNKLLDNKQKERDNKQKEIDQIQTKISNINLNKTKKKSLNNEIISFEDIISNQRDELNNYTNKKKTLNNELQEIKALSLEKQINEIQSKLKKQEEKKKNHLSIIQSLQEDKEKIDFHLFHFGKKGFKTFLANKSIRSIQDICNFYLQKFETDLQVQISGYKILKSGEVRDKIEVSIISGGKDKGLFNKYSGGEKTRIDVAGIISINRLINNGCGDRGLDLLIFDENISYLDSSGQEEIIKILSKSNITTILVMHQVDDIPYKNKVFVKKTNKNSSIVKR